jgi:hypothetical protein
MKTTGYNRRLAQWRVKWLIELSTSHQLLWCIDSFTFGAASRCVSEIANFFSCKPLCVSLKDTYARHETFQ